MGFSSSFVRFVQIQYEHLLQQYLAAFNAHIILPDVYTATALLIFLSFCFLKWRAPSSRMKLPPSPPGNWPIIGHLHLLGQYPHKSIAQMARKYGPIMFLQLGTKPHVIVSSPEMAMEVFNQHDLTFSHRPPMAVMNQMDHMNHGFVFISNNALWRKLRKIFRGELMSPKRRQQSQQIRAEETSCTLLKSILDTVTENPDAPIGVYSRVQRTAVEIFARIILGRRLPESPAEGSGVTMEALSSVIDETTLAQESFFIGDYIPWLSWVDRMGGRWKQAAEIESRLQDLMTVILDERRVTRKQAAHVDMDMVDVLLSHHETDGEDSISEDNVRALIWDAFMGGTETMVTTMEWAMAHVVQDRRVLEKLKAELDTAVGKDRRVTEGDIPQLKYLQAIVKETLRLHPPGPLGLPHHSHEPCTVAGYHIPGNTVVHVNSWAMGRDPGIWERPLDFYPERFLEEPLAGVDPASGRSFQLLPFGSGRRICPAAPFAAVTVQLVIASLVQAFEFLVPSYEVDMAEKRGRLVVRMASPLIVHVQPRLPLELYSVA